MINADGTNLQNLTNHPAYDWGPAWSPDGTKIAFASDRDGNVEIYVMNADGTNPRNLTNHPADDGELLWSRPAWSPDGMKIAFTSMRDGNAEIYVMAADGTNPRNLTHHPAQDDMPAWSPLGPGPGSPQVVHFPDPNLEAAVREALNKPTGDITTEDMATLTSLDAKGRGIVDLSGLEYAVNLHKLILVDNQISDISPLAGLIKLEYLDLAANQIGDIFPLVANHGIGAGDHVDLRWNYLDVVTPSSQAWQNIQKLLNRGVEVLYQPQRDDVVPEWRRDLQPGDILVCRSPNSPFLFIAPLMDWTHVGLYVGEGKVIEAVWSPNSHAPRGVVETSIELVAQSCAN